MKTKHQKVENYTTTDNGQVERVLDGEQNESECGEPCDPNNPCDNCDAYWERMIREGYWNYDKHRWTEKGWNEITKLFGI